MPESHSRPLFAFDPLQEHPELLEGRATLDHLRPDAEGERGYWDDDTNCWHSFRRGGRS